MNNKSNKGKYTALVNGNPMKHPVNVSRIIGIPYDNIRMQVKRSPSLSKEYKVGNDVIIVSYNPYMPEA